MTVQEEIQRLRTQATEDVLQARKDLTTVRETEKAAEQALGVALFNALELGLPLAQLAEMAELSTSTVRGYAARSQGVTTVEPEAEEPAG